MKPESFGELIRRLRLKNNLSLRLVGSEINLDQSTLSKIERNEKIAPPYIIKELSRLFQEDYRHLQVRYLSEVIYQRVKEFDYALEAVEIAKKRLIIENRGTQKNNKKLALINKIKTYFKNSPVEKAWFFGSFVRDEEKFDSDIDLLIRFDKSSKIDLLDYIGITYDLEDLLERNVDLVQEGNLVADIKEVVEQEKLLIYER